ncbi:polysaccharide lyase 6 family protein [Aestuariibacter sp. A3R04]|uniref:polysaccharide lyase 6 family protein n=1 Tax=Aestuariibacter sp. A3R04 TaxID=2841571 RepID=UPI0020903775|nr:polysaccharide lyase 6 family protein [Aestuariibacter sp. A3R04]
MIKPCLTIICFFMSFSVMAETYLVKTPAEYNDAVVQLQPGDTLVLKNGVWNDFEILFTGSGNQQNPITLTAETKGRVILSGESNLRLAGKYLHVSGLVFKNGYTPSSAVIEFRRNKDELAYHSRVSQVVIDNYNNPDKQESDYWVAMYGKHNRFDHNHLVGKRNKGVTVAVRLNSEDSQENYHRIDHNYFGYRPVFGSNGGETLRIGTSHYSLTNSFTRVDHNVFDNTNGEVEIISVKSGKNTLANNLFLEARGTLTLRHGNGNVVENNVFLGNNVDHTGGIRVINKDQVIRNNYLEGLTGYRFGSGFTVMNGVPNSSINRYHQVDNAVIEHNTLVNVHHIQLAAGSDAERSAVPINSIMNNNLIVNDEQQPFTVFDDVSGIRFEGNIANQQVLPELAAGFAPLKSDVARRDNGLLFPVSSTVQAGVSDDLKIVDKSEVGVPWYPKVPAIIAFDSGKQHSVAAEPQALVDAISNAENGDILVLEKGEIVVPRLLNVDKILTIRAREPQATTLSFERTALFEIDNGGSLKLAGLVISGKDSPDAAGNSVVRTRKWGMIENYRFEMTNSVITDLDINHSFDFFVTGKGAFADVIRLADNQFNNITGHILVLDKEIEDLGVYNAEYVILDDNVFSDVAGSVVSLYRGGTDESTFGPHFIAKGNTVKQTGTGKRNKRKAAVYLHGVQVTDITSNTFEYSAPVVVEHTVGEPKTMISHNEFIDTAAPSIEELRVDGPHTATLNGNQFTTAMKE